MRHPDHKGGFGNKRRNKIFVQRKAKMQELVSTSQVKRMLVDCGAVRPTKRAVAMVASEEGVSPDHPGQETRYWSLRFPVETIADAVQRCVDDAGKPLRGEASYSAFAAALKEVRH